MTSATKPIRILYMEANVLPIALPLYTKERSIGVMNIMLYEQRPFTAEEVQLLTATADIAANALHRSHGLHSRHRIHSRHGTEVEHRARGHARSGWTGNGREYARKRQHVQNVVIA